MMINMKCHEYGNQYCNSGHSRTGSHMGGSKIKVRYVQYLFLWYYTWAQLNTSKHGSQFADRNLGFFFNLFAELALFVTQYSRITLNSGESKNSNDNRGVGIHSNLCCKHNVHDLTQRAWLDQVCIAFNIRVSLDFAFGSELESGLWVHIGLWYCYNRPSCTGRSEITVPVTVL